MKLHKISSEADIHFEDFWTIYHAAFPAEERREKEVLTSMLALPEMQAYAVIDENAVAGILVFWELGDFTYLEHIAVNPAIRSKGHGGKILSELKAIAQSTILLEVEIPAEEDSIRRIRFYERNGFTSFPAFSYLQPSYDGVKSPLPMMLMANDSTISDAQLRAMAYALKRHIYERFYR